MIYVSLVSEFFEVIHKYGFKLAVVAGLDDAECLLLTREESNAFAIVKRPALHDVFSLCEKLLAAFVEWREVELTLHPLPAGGVEGLDGDHVDADAVVEGKAFDETHADTRLVLILPVEGADIGVAGWPEMPGGDADECHGQQSSGDDP